MLIDFENAAKLLSPIFTVLVGGFLKRYFEDKPRLISYVSHSANVSLNDEGGNRVCTHSIVVRNTGKRPTYNVRIGHHFLPQGFQVSPPVAFNVNPGPNGSAEILLPVLVPNEQITITYLYLPPLTFQGVNGTTKSDDGFATIIKALPRPQSPKWFARLMWFLALVGASTIVYVITVLVAHYLRINPAS